MDYAGIGEQTIDRGRLIGSRLRSDEAEQHQGAQHERAGDGERPAKRGCSGEIRQAHGG